MKKAIRNQYAELGVEKYYQQHAEDYQNPHVEQIKTLLERYQHQFDYNQVLDFCCGGGEVTLILKALGFEQTVGCDPFTFALYETNIQKTCLRWSFDDVIRGKLIGDYTTIICSFAMHLCDEKKLYPLVNQLFKHTENIIILTPHKRPALEMWSDFELRIEDFVLTERGKKVFLKSYGFLKHIGT
jgi:SAM-dependent methyltransferase